MLRKISVAFFLFFFLFAGHLSDSRASDSGTLGWSQRWEQSSAEIWNGQQVGPFDQMAIWAADGTGVIFGDPAFSDFSAQGWATYNETVNISARAFSIIPFSYIQFNMNYATELGVADFLYMSAYRGEVRQRQHITYNHGTGWSYPAFTGNDTEWYSMGGGDPVTVPEPPTFLLFLVLAWPVLLCYNLPR
jgi:hypothetical protein